MREIESKIIGIDKKEVLRKLASMKAKKVFDGEIRALYFDFSDGSLEKAREGIRLRSMGARSVLTFKKFITDKGAKIREEHETHVSDFESTQLILESLGLSVWLEIRKHRTAYDVNGAHVEIDKYVGEYGFIPTFLEIEAKSVAAIHRTAAMLGFKKEECKSWTMKDLIKHYSNKKRNKKEKKRLESMSVF